MARMIDAVQVLHNINLHHRPTPVSEFESGFNNGLNQAMWEITHAPTLTQPNEGAKDKNVPTNEPLTLEQLREMDGEPVWVEDVKHWALIDIEKGGQWDGVPFAVWAENGVKFTYNVESRDLHCYRRPPEGGNDVS